MQKAEHPTAFLIGPITQDCYRQRCQADPSSPHSREDVFERQFIVERKK